MSIVRAFESRISTSMGEVCSKTWIGAASRAANSAPIFLLHDSLGCVELWRKFPERLAAELGRTVVAYDRIGFGKSAPHPEKLASTFVHDEATSTFKAVADYFGIERFVVFGHSVGGGMAVEIASQFPLACEALITESAQAFVEDRTLKALEMAKLDFMRPGQIDRLKKYHGDKAEWVLSAWIDTWLSPEFAGWSLDQPAQKVTIPLLAIHGENDEYGSSEHPFRIASQVKGPSTVRMLSRCGHVPHKEVPEAVLSMVSRLLVSAESGSISRTSSTHGTT